MRPEDETPRDDETPDQETPADAPGEPEPSPSTYAARRRAGEEEAGAEPAEGAPEGAQGSGFTEEFDRIERELDAELDGLGGDHMAAGEAEQAEVEPAAAEDAEAPSAEAEEEALGEEEEPAAEEAPAAEEPEAAEELPVDDEELDEDEAPAAGETVEAETVALADREQAQEAALAGLKARAGDGKAWETGAHAVRAEDEKPPRPGRLWPRFLAASILIIVSMTVATSVSALVYLDYWGERLGDNGKFDKLSEQLDEVDGGDPQNILIIGSDERLNLPGDRRSDTTILLRVDPDQQAISLLSIPRDLRVSIPGRGPDRFNAAYSYGGADLTLKTVEQLTDINLHHVVNINFTGFADAVDAIDCVYIDVDRRYYIPPESGIAEINVEAGYQRMCGYNALQYVRYRHDDNDLVRSARQQDFLREARQKVPPWKLVEDREELLTIFTDYTTSDIDSGVELLELLKTLLAARNARLQEVHFPANLGDGTTGYVTASSEAIANTVETFLGTEGTPGPPEAGKSSEAAQRDAEQEAQANDGRNRDKPKEDKEPEPEPEGPPMENATAQGEKYAHQLSIKKTNGGDRMVTFPIFYPTALVPGSVITNDSRAFPIDGPGDEKFYGYKMSIEVPGQYFGNGLLREYYGISGTDWEDPPILENPTEERTVDGRTYQLYWDGDRLRLVAWHDKRGNSYWINNTLSQSLSGEQMMAIARSMKHDD